MLKNGFTVLELLIVIAIIGVLASILYLSINPSKRIEEAKMAKVTQELLDIKNAVTFYVIDTGTFPQECRLDCTEATDNLLTAPAGVANWGGPYLKDGLWNKKHPWGGHIGLVLYDSNGNGRPEVWVILDDDAPGTNAGDNTGTIPHDILEKIDNNVDDGDLSSGNMFLGENANTGGIFVAGEGAWRVYRAGEGN